MILYELEKAWLPKLKDKNNIKKERKPNFLKKHFHLTRYPSFQLYNITGLDSGVYFPNEIFECKLLFKNYAKSLFCFNAICSLICFDIFLLQYLKHIFGSCVV